MLFGRKPQSKEDLDRLENEGIELVRAGDYDRGFTKLKEALDLDPENPRRNNNFGGILFEVGVPIFTAGAKQEGLKILQTAEIYIKKAADLCQQDDRDLRSNCYYGLGEISDHAYGDRLKAAEWYQKALDAGHERANKALQRLEAASAILCDPAAPIANRAQELPKGECLILAMPGGWTLASDQAQDNAAVLDWLPEGQSLADWTETISVRTEVLPDATPLQYVQLVQSTFAKNWKNVETVGPESETINGYDAAMIGLDYRNPKRHYRRETQHIQTKAIQFSLYRVIRGKDYFYTILREWRGDQLGPAHPLHAESTWASWRAFVDSAEVCDTRAPGFETRCRHMTAQSPAAALGEGANVVILPPLEVRLGAGETRVAAEQGLADARDAYMSGDYATAFRLLRPLAEQGHAGAQSNLGSMYHDGRGVAQDDAEAVKWYQLAAEQGHASAQTFLGNMYEYGQGVSQDYAEALKWFRLAAEQGDADAQYSLGAMYDNGLGSGLNNA